MSPQKRSLLFIVAFISIFCGLSSSLLQAASFSITRAEWSSNDGGRLRVAGTGSNDRTVTIKNAGSGTVLGTDRVDDGSWSRRIEKPSPLPAVSVPNNRTAASPNAMSATAPPIAAR